jgi:hypothetical protein
MTTRFRDSSRNERNPNKRLSKGMRRRCDKREMAFRQFEGQ